MTDFSESYSLTPQKKNENLAMSQSVNFGAG